MFKKDIHQLYKKNIYANKKNIFGVRFFLLFIIIVYCFSGVFFCYINFNYTKSKAIAYNSFYKSSIDTRVKASTLNIGDYVDKFGTWNNRQLTWRVVDKDSDGLFLRLDTYLTDSSGKPQLLPINATGDKFKSIAGEEYINLNSSNVGHDDGNGNIVYDNPINREDVGTNYYEQSFARLWLNGDFLNSAFSEEEQMYMLSPKNLTQYLHWTEFNPSSKSAYGEIENIDEREISINSYLSAQSYSGNDTIGTSTTFDAFDGKTFDDLIDNNDINSGTVLENINYTIDDAHYIINGDDKVFIPDVFESINQSKYSNHSEYKDIKNKNGDDYYLLTDVDGNVAGKQFTRTPQKSYNANVKSFGVSSFLTFDYIKNEHKANIVFDDSTNFDKDGISYAYYAPMIYISTQTAFINSNDVNSERGDGCDIIPNPGESEAYKEYDTLVKLPSFINNSQYLREATVGEDYSSDRIITNEVLSQTGKITLSVDSNTTQILSQYGLSFQPQLGLIKGIPTNTIQNLPVKIIASNEATDVLGKVEITLYLTINDTGSGNKNLFIFIGIGVGGVFVILIIMSLVMASKKKNGGGHNNRRGGGGGNRSSRTYNSRSLRNGPPPRRY